MARALADRFRELTGRWPEGQWQAPARVNLIGEHTDYNGGLALPFAIDRYVTVAMGRRSDRQLRCASTMQAGGARAVEADLDTIRPSDLPAWARYPVGVLWALGRLGGPGGLEGFELPGIDMVIDSTVAAGAGLASSAALEAAVAVAVRDLCDAPLDRRQLAQVCHVAETEFVGAPVGLLDQLAVLCAPAGHGLLIDFRDLTLEPIALAIGPLVVVDTHVPHRNADGAYASRRQSCQEAAARLGVATLRDADGDAVAKHLDGELLRRARHVVTENERVLEAARRLRADGCGADIGALLTASHASLRDDFEVSCPELDAVVAASLAAGAWGARMTGAGFGGCAIVLGLEVDAVAAELGRRGRDHPTPFPIVVSGAAGRIA